MRGSGWMNVQSGIIHALPVFDFGNASVSSAAGQVMIPINMKATAETVLDRVVFIGLT